MRKLGLTLLSLLTALAAAPAHAQSFSGFLRGLSNTLSGGSNQPAPAQNGSTTATIGVRGMDDEGMANAGPARPEDLKLLDSWSATKVEAEIAAGKRGLVANKTAGYGEPPVAAAAPADEVPQ
jgi:hypothetical protein